MSKKNERWKPSALSKKIAMQCMLTVAVYLLTLFGGYFLAYILCSQFLWQRGDPLYEFFKLLEAISPVLIVFAIFVGLFFIMRYYFSKPLQYLDEIVAAAEQLAVSPEKTITLSKAMFETQNELNLVRERALHSAHAAREAEQRKNDLVVYLAHDLKTPLTSVIGYLSLLQDEPEISSDLRTKYTGIALSKAERLEDLINEFFDITRFNLTHLELNIQSLNLTRMLEQMTYEFIPALAEKKLSWELDLAPDILILGDPDKLERVFNNLFRNAVNYSYQESNLFLSMWHQEDQVMIQLTNHGKTIPQAKLERIFDQFFRIDSSRATATGGAGLGLAIAKEIVELHGGSICAESEEEYIAFSVSLPLKSQKIV